jgi:hypothetical protein
LDEFDRELAIRSARELASIELLPTDTHAGESSAFDVLVNGRLVGRWADSSQNGGAVTWLPAAEMVEIGGSDSDLGNLIEELRASVPVRHLYAPEGE